MKLKMISARLPVELIEKIEEVIERTGHKKQKIYEILLRSGIENEAKDIK